MTGSVERQVVAERVYDHPVTAVWPFLRRYGALAQWHPWAAATVMEDGAPEDRIGAVRIVTGQPKPNVARERLLGLSDEAWWIDYNVEAGLPVENYRARAQLWPLGAERTRLLWRASFHARPDRADRWQANFQRIYADGLQAIADWLAAGRTLA